MQPFRLKQCWAFADDILITARTEQTMIDKFEKQKNVSLKFGLIVNENKTMYMNSTKQKNLLKGLTVDNLHINKFGSFNYVGTIVRGNNISEKQIREGIAKENKIFYANKILFKSNLVSMKYKLKLCWSVIRPIVVYGCKTWVLKKSII